MISEVYPDRLTDPASAFGAIRQAIFEEHGLQPAALVLIPPRALPKTSSGKIQRSRARQRFERDDFEVIARWDAPRSRSTQPSTTDTAPPSTDDPLVVRLSQASGRARHRILVDHLKALAADLLGLEPDEIEPDRAVGEIGLDSVTAVEMVERVGRALGRSIAGTILFDHPTLDALATWLLEETEGKTNQPAETASRTHGAEVSQMSEEAAAAALLAELEDL